MGLVKDTVYCKSLLKPESYLFKTQRLMLSISGKLA